MKPDYLYILLIFILLGSYSCVQKTYKRSLTVSVDMSGILDFTTLGIRGQYPPLSWNEDLPLIDPDGDSLYTASFVLDIPFDYFAFKFITDGKNYELQGQDNRILNFEGRDKIFYEATFDQIQAQTK